MHRGMRKIEGAIKSSARPPSIDHAKGQLALVLGYERDDMTIADIEKTAVPDLAQDGAPCKPRPREGV
jgi:hypothetical protein